MLYSQFTLLEKQGSCSIVVYALIYFAHVGYLALTIYRMAISKPVLMLVPAMVWSALLGQTFVTLERICFGMHSRIGHL